MVRWRSMACLDSGSALRGCANIALAVLHPSRARRREAPDGPRFFRTAGFFVPLDDVPELIRPMGESKDRDATGQRADLLYVTAARRGGLKFAFVEVKFRRYLKTARALDLLDIIDGLSSTLPASLRKRCLDRISRCWKKPSNAPVWCGYCASTHTRAATHADRRSLRVTRISTKNWATCGAMRRAR